MKKFVLLVPVVSALVACGGAPINQSQSLPVERQKTAGIALSEAPSWVSKLPEEPGVIFAYGTGVSNDMSMADQKALHSALHKICVGDGAKMRGLEKNFKSDSDYETSEQSQHASKTICADVATSGTKQVEVKHVMEGSRIRSYVLIALPLAAKTQVALIVAPKQKKGNADAAFKDLDDAVNGKSDGAAESATDTGKPSANVTMIPAQVAVIQPNGSSGGLTLMPVENEEYKARRAAALQKPGAIIGQTTVE